MRLARLRRRLVEDLVYKEVAHFPGSNISVASLTQSCINIKWHDIKKVNKCFLCIVIQYRRELCHPKSGESSRELVLSLRK